MSIITIEEGLKEIRVIKDKAKEQILSGDQEITLDFNRINSINSEVIGFIVELYHLSCKKMVRMKAINLTEEASSELHTYGVLKLIK